MRHIIFFSFLFDLDSLVLLIPILLCSPLIHGEIDSLRVLYWHQLLGRAIDPSQ